MSCLHSWPQMSLVCIPWTLGYEILTVIIVGDQVAILIVGGRQGLQRWLCGGRVEVNQGLSPDPERPLLPPTSLPISFLSSGSSAFSLGRSGQSLFLLGVGLGCFWRRRMYSTKREADSEQARWVNLWWVPSVPRPESSPHLSRALLTVFIILPLYLVIVVQCGHLRLLLWL